MTGIPDFAAYLLAFLLVSGQPERASRIFGHAVSQQEKKMTGETPEVRSDKRRTAAKAATATATATATGSSWS